MNTDERDELTKEIEKYRLRFNTGSHLWSSAHHGSLSIAAIFSTATALILKLDSTKADFAAILSAIAALMGVLAMVGGFQRKWKSNRISRGKLDLLLIDLSDSATDTKNIRSQLKSIITDHDRIITAQN